MNKILLIFILGVFLSITIYGNICKTQMGNCFVSNNIQGKYCYCSTPYRKFNGIIIRDAPPKPKPITVGISSNIMNYYSANQENSQWCWAASIQMVLNYYGVSIGQKQIVARTYGRDSKGRLKNSPGSIVSITRNLNNWNIDNTGHNYIVRAQYSNKAPVPSFLIKELKNKRPVLVGYRSGPKSGHAVIITGITYIKTNMGPQIISIVVRDPWPSPENIRNKGKVVYNARNFASKIYSHWYIRVKR